MAYLGKGRIAELKCIAKQLGKKVTDDLKIIDLKNLIVNSPNYEEFVREMLNMIIVKRLKTSTSRVRKYFDLNERYILSTYGLETLLKLEKHNSKTINKVKSKESAPLIQRVKNGMNNDQEIAPMQLVSVRREFSQLNVDRVGPLPIIQGDKYILPDLCMSPKYHEPVPVSLIQHPHPLWKHCCKLWKMRLS
ncbi:uncharacterized protein TNCV_3178661 [Trichonephila clavipes]|nr:uncharacterized protein TNCV_3178661 [Trichonephila clavipes]